MLLTDVGRSVLLGETVISGTPLVISNYSPAAVILSSVNLRGFQLCNIFVPFEFYSAEIKISLPYLATLLLINHLKCHFSFEL